MDKRLFLNGEFGLEKESLRVTEDGFFAQSKHPFSDKKHIVRDFCENQTEINTDVASSPEGVIWKLKLLTRDVFNTLQNMNPREYLWSFSNPPVITKEEDIPIAEYFGEEKPKRIYREHLAKRYGRYKMTHCGIHVNYSFPRDVLEKLFSENALPDIAAEDADEFSDRLYLKLAEELLNYGWLVSVLTAASPLTDASFFQKETGKQAVFTGYASLRNSKDGYWNDFVPILSYRDVTAYANSIECYVFDGSISQESEFYYPIRLKSKGINSLKTLRESGVHHIELRNVDVNPFLKEGIDVRDLKFIQLFLGWLAAKEPEHADDDRQRQNILNFKNAVAYDLNDSTIILPDGRERSIKKASLDVLGRVEDFYREIEDQTGETLFFQRRKLECDDNRYAVMVKKHFSDDFIGFGMAQAKKNEEYPFYGWRNANVSAIHPIYPDIRTPYDLYDALSLVWCRETCTSRLRDGWSEDDRTLGQCAITAFLVQDIFGGEVYGVPRPAGNFHCYNVVDGHVFDLTSEQFHDEVLSYEDNPLQSREVHFSDSQKKFRYERLKELLRDLTRA